jgi:hypothetical protein
MGLETGKVVGDILINSFLTMKIVNKNTQTQVVAWVNIFSVTLAASMYRLRHT